PGITPGSIIGVGGIGGAIGGEAEILEFGAVKIEVSKTGGEIADRNARGRQEPSIVNGPLADDVALTLPTDAGDIREIDWIAASFIIHVSDQGIDIGRLGVDLVSDGDIKGLVAGVI